MNTVQKCLNKWKAVSYSQTASLTDVNLKM